MAEVTLGSSWAPEDSLLESQALLSQSHEFLKHAHEHGRQYMEQEELRGQESFIQRWHGVCRPWA